MAIVGHPRIAGGHDIPQTAEGHDVSESAEKFAALYQLLAKHNVRIAMADDTHDFEYYKERRGGDRDKSVMHHFVNGGGGTYLSIGTALDFPNPGPVCGLGILSQDRSASRQARCGDAALEATVLAMDQMVQRVAVQRRGAVRHIRFQPLPVLPEFHAGSGRTFEKTYCSHSLRCRQPTALERPTDQTAPFFHQKRPLTIPSNSSYQWIRVSNNNLHKHEIWRS
jgi:hypothetical protein